MRLNGLFALPVVLFALIAPAQAETTMSSCRLCHENPQRMQELGFPHFTVSSQEVQAQTRHSATDCQDCHLGNPQAPGTEEAHKGLARLLVIRKKGLTSDRSPRNTALAYGSNPANKLYISTGKDGQQTRDASVATLQWQDKRADSLAFDTATAEKTCGVCHPKELKEFSKSPMGAMSKQSQYAGWTDPQRGPHNCGPWFEGNLDKMQANTAIPISPTGHVVNQKVCNTCHTGCLDCHFTPQPKNAKNPAIGSHTFTKTPPSPSCYGNGRANLCHAGPEDNRRGAGIYGGPFSIPEGNEPDVHVRAKVGCLDCHDSSQSDKRLAHGVVKRQAQGSCVRCHQQAVAGHAASLHKNLTCEACHIQQVAGYQATYWGPGKLAGIDTPFFKYKGYQGIMPQPILIKDQRGRWIPVKPYPMAALNQREAPFKPGLYWRYPIDLPDHQRTDDAWAFTGLHGGLVGNNKAMTWIQLDKLSHKLGKARSCDSCHADLLTGTQVQKVTWNYDGPGAEPFTGSHTVAASRNSLKIKDIQAHERVVIEKGFAMSALAPWAYLDVWEVSGDFSIPVPHDKAHYSALKGDPKQAKAKKIIH